MRLFVVDVDCAAAHATGGVEAPQRWRNEQRERFELLLEVHPGGFVGLTKKGYRIVYRLQPLMVSSAAETDERRLRGLLDEFSGR